MLAAVVVRERLVAYLILAAVLGAMLWTVGKTFNADGYLAAWDAGGHLLKAWYFAHHHLPSLSLSGYFPVWHGGFALFQFYPPLLYYLLGPLTWMMEPELALRLFTAALWLGLVPATYYFLRSWHIDRISAALAVSLLLALNASYGVGLGALYGVGLLPNGLGCVLAIVALGRLKRDLTWPERGLRHLLLTGGTVALLFLAHTFSAYWYVLAASVLVVAEGVGSGELWIRHLKRFAITMGLGVVLSAYWWVPLVLALGEMGQPGAVMETPRIETLSHLILAKQSGGAVVSLLAAAGLGYLVATASWRGLGYFVGLLLLTLGLSLNLINPFLPFAGVVASSQYIRFHAFFSWTLIALAAFALAGAWQICRRVTLPYMPETLFGGGFGVLLVLVVLPTLRSNARFVATVDNAATAELPATERYLRENLRPGEFILSQFDWSSREYFGSPHFVSQHLPLLNDRIWDLNGNFPEGTKGSAQPVLVANLLDRTEYLDGQRDYLVGRGVRFIVTTSPSVRPRLTEVAWLRPVHVQHVLAVYEIIGFDRPLGLPSEVGSRLADVRFEDPKTYRINFREPVTLPAGTSFALSHGQGVRLEARGQRLHGSAGSDGRLVLDASLAGVKTLSITHVPSPWSRLASYLSAVALLFVVIYPRLLGWRGT